MTKKFTGGSGQGDEICLRAYLNSLGGLQSNLVEKIKILSLKNLIYTSNTRLCKIRQEDPYGFSRAKNKKK